MTDFLSMALKQLSRKINCLNLFYSQLTFYKPPQNMMFWKQHPNPKMFRTKIKFKNNRQHWRTKICSRKQKQLRKKVIKTPHSTTESSTRTAQINHYSWQKTHFRILSKIRSAIQKILGYPSRGGENALGTFATGSGTGRRSYKRGGGKILRHSARVPHGKTSLMSPGYIMFRIISSASATLNLKMSWKSRLHSRLLSPLAVGCLGRKH